MHSPDTKTISTKVRSGIWPIGRLFRKPRDDWKNVVHIAEILRLAATARYNVHSHTYLLIVGSCYSKEEEEEGGRAGGGGEKEEETDDSLERLTTEHTEGIIPE